VRGGKASRIKKKPLKRGGNVVGAGAGGDRNTSKATSNDDWRGGIWGKAGRQMRRRPKETEGNTEGGERKNVKEIS